MRRVNTPYSFSPLTAETRIRSAVRRLMVMVMCVGLLALGTTPAWAQSNGTVAGVVSDPTGAVVAGANVALVDTATHNARTTSTNEAGRYVFVNVPPGSYDLTVTQTGFAVAKARQTVSVGLVSTVNISLKVGSANQEVVVEATGAQLQTMNATVGTSLSFDLAQALPGLSRDVSGLVLLQPATAPNGSTAGSVSDQNMFTLDGGNNSNDMDGNNAVYTGSFASNPLTGSSGGVTGGLTGAPTGVMPTPVESIEEFKVGVTNQTADFNAAAGSQVQMVTRRGTNSWHGAAYEYYFGSNFSANTWANGHSPSKDKAGNQLYYTPLPSRHQNRFGASAGGPIAPKFLGGKTYLFGFYQGVRYPNISSFTRTVPSDLMRAGVIQVQDSAGAWQPYNLNPAAVTVKGVTYQPAPCPKSPNGLCDPRGIGINPIVKQIWDSWMPAGNDPSGGDQHNTLTYRSSLALPQKDNNLVFRLDHDFGQNWKFMASYRYYHLTQASNCQTDIGGILGGSKGQIVSTCSRPQVPSYYVAGLTTTLTPKLTNNFVWNYTRNYWEWDDALAPPQPIAGLGGAVEIGGESANALIPYNVNTQNVRTRFWNGQDHMFRDDVTWLHGNHLVQFGGLYQRNWNWHQRNDNGQGIMAANVYQVGDVGGSLTFAPSSTVNYYPTAVPSSQQSNYQSLYAQVLGLVTQPQTMYTRTGADLHLLPLGTPAFDQSTIPFYQGYVSDTWHLKPTITVTYGLSYSLEMPPFESAGKQVMLVDQAGNAIDAQGYLKQRQAAALQGQVYNPIVGFATVGNVAGGLKYPYKPFYGGFSPRLAATWNPRADSGIMGKLLGGQNTVIRGGYSRVVGRLNGVDLVLVPLLGTGLMQAVQCNGAVNAANAVNGSQCLGVGGANPATAFRIGTDGLVAPLGGTPSNTLPQPYFPGVAGNLAAGDGSVLDPNFRPNIADQITVSIQREVSSKIFAEVGYIGKFIHNEFQEIDIDAVPWMTTLGGQSFANAYAQVYTALCGLNSQTCPSTPPGTVAAQPFFEAAMGGPGSAYCTGFSSCTAAVVSRQGTNIKNNAIYQLWTGLETSTQAGWVLGRTMPSSNPAGGCKVSATSICKQVSSVQYNVSNGFGNYNGAYLSVTFRDWHGLTARSNFTWAKALGTGAEVQARSTRSVPNPWDLRSSYGPQDFDTKFLYTLAVYYAPNQFKSQQGILGHLLGGWSLSPLFTAQSGYPLRVQMTQGSCTICQAFGESAPGSTTSWENGVLIGPYTGGNSTHYTTTAPGTKVGTNASAKNPAGQNTLFINMFQNPDAVYGEFRRLVLGVDTRANAAGILRGLPRWNMDMTIAKDIRATERFGLTFTTQMTNVLNHFQPSDPTLNLNTPSSFGVISSQAYDSRNIEFGLRVRW